MRRAFVLVLALIGACGGATATPDTPPQQHSARKIAAFGSGPGDIWAVDDVERQVTCYVGDNYRMSCVHVEPLLQR